MNKARNPEWQVRDAEGNLKLPCAPSEQQEVIEVIFYVRGESQRRRGSFLSVANHLTHQFFKSEEASGNRDFTPDKVEAWLRIATRKELGLTDE